MNQEGLAESGLILLDPVIARELSFEVWTLADESNLLVYPIPRTLFNSLKTFGGGGLSRYTTQMLILISNRLGSAHIHLNICRCEV